MAPAQSPGASPVPEAPQFPGGPQFTEGAQFPEGTQFAGGQRFQGGPTLTGQPQPGYDQRFGPGGPGMPGGPDGPGGPRGPGGPGGPGGPAMRRRITDAWARLGSLTPAAGLAAVKRANGAGHPADENAEPSAKSSSNRNKALVAGAGVLAVVAVGGVVVAPKLLGGSPDPGCKAYASTAITAYNKTIDDLNAQATQSVLAVDMSMSISGLTSAISQAQSDSVKSALTGLLTQLKSVQADVKSGSLPTAPVNSLNAASATADNAC
jgi:hypothetical protein